MTGERRIIERGLARCHTEMRRIATSQPSSEPATDAATARIADLTDQVSQSERRLTELDGQIAELQRDLVTETDVAAALVDFDNVWTALSPREQVRLINLLVHRVEFDAADSSIKISFYPSGIKALAYGDANEPIPGEESRDAENAPPAIAESPNSAEPLTCAERPPERAAKHPRRLKEDAA